MSFYDGRNISQRSSKANEIFNWSTTVSPWREVGLQLSLPLLYFQAFQREREIPRETWWERYEHSCLLRSHTHYFLPFPLPPQTPAKTTNRPQWLACFVFSMKVLSFHRLCAWIRKKLKETVLMNFITGPTLRKKTCKLKRPTGY